MKSKVRVDIFPCVRRQSADFNLDFSFDWSIRYSASSPAKLSLAQSHIVSGLWGRRQGLWGKMSNDSYSARDQDKEEFTSELWSELVVGRNSDPS